MDSVLEEEQISSAAAWSLTSSGVSLIASAGEENRQQPVVDVISSETKNKEKNNNKLAALDVGNEEVAFHAVEESMVTFSAVDQVSEDNSSSMTKHSFLFYEFRSWIHFFVLFLFLNLFSESHYFAVAQDESD